jgi:antitoxin component of RelBE/YafQ-DinJ toxin-antitoxin module
MNRDRIIRFRVSDEERARFAALAEHYGLAISDLLRMLLKRDADAIAASIQRTSP